jgi:hypothetical protein
MTKHKFTNVFFIFVDVICYDDACHLKKFACNPKRNEKTDTAKRLSKMDIVCDRFHFKNHVDRWCKQNCNPHKCEKLKVKLYLHACI